MSQPETLSVRQMVEAHGAIQALINADRQNKFVFPSAVRIKLAGNLRKTREVFEDYVTEKNELVKRLGSVIQEQRGQDKDNNPIFVDTDKVEVKVDSPNYPEFKAQHDAMLAADTRQTLNAIDAKDLGENQIDVELITVLQDTGLLAG